MIQFPSRKQKYNFTNFVWEWRKEQRIPRVSRTIVPDAFKFIDGLPWEDGDFADKNSCFWACRNVVREILLSHGTKSIQLFKKNKGIGRALVLPLGGHPNYYLLFNAYGYPLSFFRKFLETYWDVNYNYVDTYNDGDDDEIIYTNGNLGYLFPRKEIDILNLGVDVSDIENLWCKACDNEFYGYVNKKTQVCPYCKKRRKTISMDDYQEEIYVPNTTYWGNYDYKIL